MGEVDPAILIYLAILLIGVGSFIFGDFRNKLTQNLQQAAIWVMIFLGAVGLYGAWDVIGPQLFPSSAVVRSDGVIVLRRAPDRHFYADVEVNGQVINFMIDTGATEIVLNRETAAEIGFDPEGLRFSGRANTANGLVQTAPVRLDSIAFGGRTDRGVRASVNGGKLDTPLLGMSYLSRFSSVEFAGNELRLKP